MWVMFVAGRTLYGQFDTTKLATIEGEIATGGDLTFSLCVARRVKPTSNKIKLVDITKIMISLR